MYLELYNYLKIENVLFMSFFVLVMYLLRDYINYINDYINSFLKNQSYCVIQHFAISFIVLGFCKTVK